MLAFYPIPFFIGALLLIGGLAFIQFRKSSTGLTFCAGLFGIYLLALVAVLFFPMPLSDPAYPNSWERALFTFQHVNLIPFKFHLWEGMPVRIIRDEFLNNLIMTIPFGFGLPFLVSSNWKRMTFIALAVGFSTEGLQLILSLLLGGFRTVDITDVILNAGGVMIGYGTFILFAHCLHAVIHQAPTNWLARYIFDKTQNS